MSLTENALEQLEDPAAAIKLGKALVDEWEELRSLGPDVEKYC